MSVSEPPGAATATPEQLRDEWVARVTDLVARVEAWCRELDWVSKRIDVGVRYDNAGPYHVPALVFQKDTTRLLLEPLAGYSSGAEEGVVDLCQMPGMDDVARFVTVGGDWRVYSADPAQSGSRLRDDVSKPLTRKAFGEVVEGRWERDGDWDARPTAVVSGP